ncbi:hypothetical protein [Salinirubrum litoreum]|uniref:Restriction endonuclease n=1 Tax=Salinirubrum litoreum TaxID=1126234 RepID=A0ABD5R638_9EURY|nr:hypothetical protein [Salinirubrum litoreum]
MSYPDEDAVQEFVIEFLRSEGFDATDIDTNRDIPDVVADADDSEVAWYIEVKGENRSPKDRVYTAIGQVVYGMSADSTRSDTERWAVAFPERRDGRNQYLDYFDSAAAGGMFELLDLYLLLVAPDGDVEIFTPADVEAR